MKVIIGSLAGKAVNQLRKAILEAYQKQFYPLGYVPALDGLRGLITVTIVISHVYYSKIPGVILYIDVLFAGSSYYITSMLLRDLNRYGRINYREFYRRRFARILPPFLAMIGGYLLFRLLFVPPFSSALAHSAIALTYISNYWFIADPAGIADLAHTWTLSVEEQFYILWPITFAFLARRFGVTWRLVFVICIIAVSIWSWRAWLAFHEVPWQRVYAAFDTRADDLMAGSAMAVILQLLPPGKSAVLDRILPALAWPLLLYWIFITVFFWHPDYPSSPFYYYGSFVCGAVPGIITITMLIRSTGTICHRILERPEAVFLGHIFYGIYLWHFPIVWYLFEHNIARKYQVMIALPLSILFGTLSYAYIDRYFMRLRSQREPAAPGLQSKVATNLKASS